jgi:uncharacterized membrane protein YfbV (UPF0208 family)
MNPYLATLLDPFHTAGKIPDLQTQPSCEFYQAANIPVTVDANGNFAFAFTPARVAAVSAYGFYTSPSSITAGGTITWGSGVASTGYSAVAAAYAAFRLVSAGLIFIPTSALTAVPPLVTVNLVPGAATVNGIVTASLQTVAPTIASMQSYGAAVVSAVESWQCNYKPLDPLNLTVYTAPGTGAPNGDNIIIVGVSGAPISTTIGRLYFLANYEGVPGYLTGGISIPTPSPAHSAWIESACNKLSTVPVVTSAQFYGSPMTGGMNLGAASTGAVPSAVMSAMQNQVSDISGSASAAFASGVSSTASSAAHWAGQAAMFAGINAGLYALRRHLRPQASYPANQQLLHDEL